MTLIANKVNIQLSSVSGVKPTKLKLKKYKTICN